MVGAALCRVAGCRRPATVDDLCSEHSLQALPAVGVPRPAIRRCAVAGCDRDAVISGLCEPHYARRIRRPPRTPHVVDSPVCAVDDCDRAAKHRGLCSTHYSRQLHGEPNWDRPIKRQQAPGRSEDHSRITTPCSVPSCPHPAYARGLCQRHYDRRRRNDADWDRPVNELERPTCFASDCSEEQVRLGYCLHHYRELVAEGTLPANAGPCQVADCTREAYRAGLCHTHYRRRLAGMPDWDTRPLKPSANQPTKAQLARQAARKAETRICRIEGCGRRFYKSGLCASHYHRRLNGWPDWDTRPIRPHRRRDEHGGP